MIFEKLEFLKYDVILEENDAEFFHGWPSKAQDESRQWSPLVFRDVELDEYLEEKGQEIFEWLHRKEYAFDVEICDDERTGICLFKFKFKAKNHAMEFKMIFGGSNG